MEEQKVVEVEEKQVVEKPLQPYHKYERKKKQEISSFESPLPITFRLNKNIPRKDQMVKLIAEEYPLFKRISWLTTEDAYQLEAEKLEIRKKPELKKYQNFLQDQDALGKISRQELVSMIPASLIDAQPNEKILDMCAAPGSKTKQMLENLMKGENSLLFANDLSKKRAFMLAFHVLKLHSNCAVITANDCTTYPKVVAFDKVLCDVPCSGDGTIRKQNVVLKRWSSKLGKNLHCLQLSLLLRALYLVRVGGKVVYSTCSLNPMENESVVSGALHLLKPYIKITDARDKFPGFKFADVLQKWPVVQSKMHNAYWSYASIDPDVHGLKGKKIFETMFPLEDVTGSLRILPHDNDTGGFFVAVLEKTADFDEKMIVEMIHNLQQYYSTAEGSKALAELQEQTEEASTNETEETKKKDVEVSNDSEVPVSVQNKKEDSKLFEVNSLVPLRDVPHSVEELIDFYGFKDDSLMDSLRFIRVEATEANSRNVFMISKSIQELIKLDSPQLHQLQVVNIGLKVFESLQKSPTTPELRSFRILQEGIEILLDKVEKQRICVENGEDYLDLVNNLPKKFNLLSETLQGLIAPMKPGVILVTFGKNHAGPFTLWKGINTLTVLLDKEEKKYANFAINNKLFE